MQLLHVWMIGFFDGIEKIPVQVEGGPVQNAVHDRVGVLKETRYLIFPFPADCVRENLVTAGNLIDFSRDRHGAVKYIAESGGKQQQVGRPELLLETVVDDFTEHHQVGIEVLAEVPDLVQCEVGGSWIESHFPDCSRDPVAVYHEESLVFKEGFDPVIDSFKASQPALQISERKHDGPAADIRVGKRFFLCGGRHHGKNHEQ